MKKENNNDQKTKPNQQMYIDIVITSVIYISSNMALLRVKNNYKAKT